VRPRGRHARQRGQRGALHATGCAPGDDELLPMDPGGRQGADRASRRGCAGLTRPTLAEALGVTTGDVVALVGGGGKTTAMFRLAREIVERGERVLTTSTTHIFAEQVALAPASVRATEATRERVLAALSAPLHV